MFEELLRYWYSSRMFNFERTCRIPKILDDKSFNSPLLPSNYIRKVRFLVPIDWNDSLLLGNSDDLLSQIADLARLKNRAHITVKLQFTEICQDSMPADWCKIGEVLTPLLQLFRHISVLGHTVFIDLRHGWELVQHL